MDLAPILPGNTDPGLKIRQIPNPVKPVVDLQRDDSDQVQI